MYFFIFRAFKNTQYITQKTKGIMIVHKYHFAANMKKLLAIAKKHNHYMVATLLDPLIFVCYSPELGERKPSLCINY